MPGFLVINQMMIKSIKQLCLISFWISLFQWCIILFLGCGSQITSLQFLIFEFWRKCWSLVLVDSCTPLQLLLPFLLLLHFSFLLLWRHDLCLELHWMIFRNCWLAIFQWSTLGIGLAQQVLGPTVLSYPLAGRKEKLRWDWVCSAPCCYLLSWR